MRTYVLPLVLLAGALACQSATEPTTDADLEPDLRQSGEDGDKAGGSREYRVTLYNLTTGQPMSPGVVLTHARRVDLFSVRGKASAGIQAIAEEGDPSVAVSELTGVKGVGTLLATEAPVHRIGGPGPSELSVTVTSERGMRYLSLAVMLICTNDGFTGLDRVRLPNRGQATYYAAGYDAGTEKNSEVAGDIVPPCFGIGPVTGPVGGGGRTGEQLRIRHHPNIRGGADLTSAHKWRDPVLKVVIERIR